MHSNADALSRITETANAVMDSSKKVGEVSELQKEDNEWKPLITYLKTGKLDIGDKNPKLTMAQLGSFYLDENDLLFKKTKGKEGEGQLVVPASLKYEILMSYHDAIHAAHMGIKKTY